jgi:uncharacterized membrane protein
MASPQLRPGQVNSLRAEVHSVEFSTYSGPLPHPDILRSFEEIVPGSAQRIFVQFEAQSSHRREMEGKVISSGAFSQRVGSVSAALIGVLGVAGGLWLTHEGKSVQGLTALLSTLGVLVSTYLYKRKRQDQERDSKQNPQQNKGK